MQFTGLPAFVILVFVSLIWVVPLWRLLPRFGVSKWLSCLGFIPGIGGFASIILLWVIAFRDPVTPEVLPEVFS